MASSPRVGVWRSGAPEQGRCAANCSGEVASGLFVAVEELPYRAYEVPLLTEHDGPGFWLRSRADPNQQLVAGGDEGCNLGSGVSVGADDIGVYGAHLAGERDPDGVGVGVGRHPEPGSGIHVLVIMARPGIERPWGRGGPAVCGASHGHPTNAPARPARAQAKFPGSRRDFWITPASKTSRP